MNVRTRREFITGMLAMTAAGTACGGSGEKGLRDLAGGQPLVGVALPWFFDERFPAKGKRLILRHFDSFTPENCMKWQQLCPQEGVYNFDRPDRMMAHAERHHLKVVGHTLVFNRKKNYPDWVFRDGSGKADAKLVWKRIEEYLETVMGRYKGKVDSWDVLNEFVETNDSGYRHTDFTDALGPDFPIRLFKMAASIDPKAKLIYNDFGLEGKNRRQKILTFVKKLQDAGCRVDVVGSQSHLEIDTRIDGNIAETIEDFSKIGVRTAFTELDVDLVPRRDYWSQKTREEAAKRNPYVNGAPDKILEKQATVYENVMTEVMENRKWVDRVTFWGLDDGHSWLNSWPWKRRNHGLLFDRDFNEKPAFHAVRKALSGS